MTTANHSNTTTRQLYMVLSPHSLAYASLALESLFANCIEPVHLRLITDSGEDKQRLTEAVYAIAPASQHQWTVASQSDLDDAEADVFGGLSHLRAFRHGHPCWRKITDPVLMSEAGAELILLDPDLYFPNRFSFETTPASGLLLMWQQPNCLLPSEVVRAAMDAGIPLARHVDIGVSHWRAQVELDWLNWLIGKLGGTSLPRMMHVEAIVWAAIAMRQGGGYLDPKYWSCWHRSQTKRVQCKLGVSGRRILFNEPWAQMKCFHAGGEAKWWLPEASVAEELRGGATLTSAGHVLPFVELSPGRYSREQQAKSLLRALGYHRFFSASQS